MSSAWDRLDASRVAALAAGASSDAESGGDGPASPSGELRFLAGADLDAASVRRAASRRMSSFEASARAYTSVNAHIARAKARGAFYELAFDGATFGFTVALARRRCVPGSPRSPAARSWCTLTVEDMDAALAREGRRLAP